MIDINKFDDSFIRVYNIIERLNFRDLRESLEDKSLYLTPPFDYEIGDKLNYSELNLDNYQQEVIEKYIKFQKYEANAKVMLAYIKAVEHTIKFIKDTEILRKTVKKDTDH